jgi:uncharacterized protein YndB with AHSA1/START domain
MLTSRFHITIDAPIELVWDLLTDYPGYARFPKVKWARLAEPGKDHPAGVGALRELNVDGINFSERIVEFEPPHVLAYKIEKSSPLPIKHDIGRMKLSERGGQTDLDWETTFALDVPVVGGPLTHVVKLLLERTFWKILHFTKADLERRARAG